MPEKASNLLYIERKHKKALPYQGGSFRFVLCGRIAAIKCIKYTAPSPCDPEHAPSPCDQNTISSAHPLT